MDEKSNPESKNTDSSNTSANTNDDIKSMNNGLKYEILPDDHTQYDLSFKVIVIGDSGVGKSCLTNQAAKNIFEDAYQATIGFEFVLFNVKINDKILRLQIWDTCGQELYRSLITNFYRNTSLAVMVYGINNKDSFSNIDSWLKELRMHSNPDSKVFLIGNKSDLENERQVETQLGEQYTKDNNLHLFMECSAKTGFNTKKIFLEAATILYQDYLKYKVGEPKEENNEGKDSNKLNKNNLKNRKKKGCC